MNTAEKTAAVIVAAGRGRRAGGDLPKQYALLGAMPVLAHSILAFLRHPRIDRVLVVLHPDDTALFARKVAPHLGDPLPMLCEGGETRALSVKNGLELLDNKGISRVLIHDGARPLVSSGLIDRVLDTLCDHKGAAPAQPMTDTLWRGAGGQVTGALDRQGIYRAQTPQGFDFTSILAAHRAAGTDATDDVQIARAAGLAVAIVAGEAQNIKITTPGDFARATQLAGGRMDIRTGNGFDVHAFGPGDHVTLMGVKIAHDQGLRGHSDADVAMHALSDALYGALAKGDIGQWFPPSDPQWKGADSELFLRHAMQLAQDEGYRVSNLDCTIICEFPKIGPHSPAMRARISEITGIEVDRVSIKATTSEQLGFTGRKEGIAALATVTLVKP